MDIDTFLWLLRNYLSIYRPEQLDPSLNIKDSAGCHMNDFDFIIVGAGSSGCVLANRLSANPNWNVLLIEAGGDEDYLTDTPALANQLLGRKYDWNYTTTEQENTCLDKQGRCEFPRGHVMGGTSSINELLYARGHPAVYDQWEAMGNPGWSWEQVLTYFKKSENMTIPQFAKDIEYHSKGGPLHIGYPRRYSQLALDYFNAAIYQYGVDEIDYNGPEHIGSNYVQSNLFGVTRHSASKAFLNPIKFRKNLYIFKNTLAIKVLFNDERAIGVTCVTNEEQYNVYASKEVILAAGAIGSAKLLMLSGVGPRQHLQQLGIPLVIDLPVGQYFVDLPVVVCNYRADIRELQYDDRRFNYAIEEYTRYRTGLLTGSHWLLYTLLNITNPYLRDTIPNSVFIDTFTLPPLTTYTEIPTMSKRVGALSPGSRGTVTLKSANYSDPPLINPNYYSDPNDIEFFYECLSKSLNYLETPLMQSYSPQLIEPPQCGKFPGNFTREYTQCFVKYQTTGGWSPSSTAKMGRDTDNTAVVDSRLKIHGLAGIRVADASIVPKPPLADLFATELMIGEKASDMIYSDYIDGSDE